MGAYRHPQLKHRSTTTSSPAANTGYYFVPRAVCAWFACGFLSLAVLHIICCSPSSIIGQESVISPLIHYLDDTYSFVSSEPKNKKCNYSEGEWVYAPGHDCIRNGRPDTGYLDWRWKPAGGDEGCRLPPFNPRAFLAQVRGKHVAFVGDSMARNQVQSLICLLGSSSSSYPAPRVVYRDRNPYKYYFWRWFFPSHDVTVSFYWAPFIAKATGKATNDSVPGQATNYVDLAALDDRWAADADTMDVVVFSVGHWLLNGAVYYNGTEMVGVHHHPELSNTTTVVGYAWPMRVAYRKAFDRLMMTRKTINVVLATFSPAHFEGNTLTTACPRKKPYKKGETRLRPLEEELRTILYEEAEAATRKAAESGEKMTMSVDVLDVTKLAIMRPDGHPGPYMNRDPFGPNGVQEWMSADCLHFCLPGPVDTFNEILQQMLLRKKR